MTERDDRTRRCLIRLIEVEHAYPARTLDRKVALGPLSLEVYRSEFLTVLGPSGSGKTTLLRIIAGLETPRAGRVELDGRDATDARRFPPEKRSVGIVFQDYALFPHLTVWENVGFGLSGHSGARRRRVGALLSLVGLADRADRYPHELSGGEQQRVALARTLAPHPEVVLLDEPFSNLDADLRCAMREEVREILKETGSTVVLVTHDQEEAFDFGNRVAILNEGRLEQVGPTEEICFNPATRFVARFIGRSDFLPGRRVSEGLKTELGVFPLKNGARADFESWELMIRPDMVGIEPDPAGQAMVVARRYDGAHWLYCLKLPSGRRLHSLQPSTRILDEGSRVRVEVQKDRPIPFPLPKSPGPADER